MMLFVLNACSYMQTLHFFSFAFSMKCLAQKARDAMRRRHKCFMTS